MRDAAMRCRRIDSHDIAAFSEHQLCMVFARARYSAYGTRVAVRNIYAVADGVHARLIEMRSCYVARYVVIEERLLSFCRVAAGSKRSDDIDRQQTLSMLSRRAR